MKIFTSKVNFTNNQLKFIIFLACLFWIPFIIGNFYFAFYDKTCIINSNILNLKNYLIISGLNTIFELFAIIFILIIIDDKYILSYSIAILYLYLIYNIICNFVGGVIFWFLINNSSCSYSIYNYIIISEILSIFRIITEIKRFYN
jgi:hypothetical protein